MGAVPPAPFLLGQAEGRRVQVEVRADTDRVARGRGLAFTAILRVAEHWHLGATPAVGDAIPTALSVQAPGAITLDDLRYPAGITRTLDVFPDPVSLYEGEVTIAGVLRVSATAPTGPLDATLTLQYQACDDQTCEFPETVQVPVRIVVRQGLPGAGPPVAGGLPPDTALPPAAAPDDADAKTGTAGGAGFFEDLAHFDAERFLARYGLVLALLAAYILGLGLCLTPCVYPIIPITVGYFGSQAGGAAGRRVLLAVVFGLGMAATYAVAGTFAALTGSLFGAALQSPWVLLALAALCVVMGLNAFGVWELRLPAALMNLAGGTGHAGVAGSLVMGLTMGIAAAPCVGAFVVSLLAYVGQRGDVVFGSAIFFCLGLGLSTPFMVLGAFTGLLAGLPRSGGWMIYAKKLMGGLLFGAALYFLRPMLSEWAWTAASVMGLTAAGLYFGFMEPTPARSAFFRGFRWALAVALFAVAAWMVPAGSAGYEGPAVSWQTYSDAAVERAAAEGRPVVIDFTAAWCLVCKELDHDAFRDPRVVDAAKGLLALRADLTTDADPAVQELRRRYRIRGLPAVVFLDGQGQEREELRIIQFESAGEVLRRFQAALAR